MFVDEVQIEVTGGRGGDGALSFRREKYVPHGGPDGGDGGNGGSVILKAETSLHTLLDFRYRRHWKAPDGAAGAKGNRSGRRGEDLVIPVPAGTVVRSADGKIIADLVHSGQETVIARGGKGGRGNRRFVSSRRRAPRLYDRGEPGESKKIGLELKLIADVAIVGFPNAGKSTLISVISAARPKIADYPFTTLVPNLGVVAAGDDGGFVVADLPGLIEGAHGGAGQGDLFLRHAERSLLLLHLVDVSGIDGNDPVDTYGKLINELSLYSSGLAGKPQVVVGNKVDLPGARENLEQLRAFTGRQENPVEVAGISAVTGEGVKELVGMLALKIDSLRRETPRQDTEPVIEIKPVPAGPVIKKKGDAFIVRGEKIERLVSRTDFENDEALQRFHRFCKRIDLDSMLKKAGARQGDVIRIGDYELIFEEEH